MYPGKEIGFLARLSGQSDLLSGFTILDFQDTWLQRRIGWQTANHVCTRDIPQTYLKLGELLEMSC
jgi:hypothetical protein